MGVGCTVLAYAEFFADGERAPFKTLADSVFSHVRAVDGVIEAYRHAVAKGYFEGDEFDGHFVTSDLGCLKNGRLRVSGRADSLIVLDDGGMIARRQSNLNSPFFQRLERFASLVSGREAGR